MSGERYLLDSNAIIAATTLQFSAALITADQKLMSLPNLTTLDMS